MQSLSPKILSPTDKSTWTEVSSSIFPSLSYLNFCFVTSSGIFNTGHDTFWYTIFCFQVRLTQLLPSETRTITPNLRWYNWSHLALAQLFPSDTCSCSQVKLAQLFPSETGNIVHTGIMNFKFVFCFVACYLARLSLVSFTWEELFHVPGLWHMISLQLFCA